MNGSVSFEEARYWEMLLQEGLDEDYDAWLDKRLEEEEPLSDLVTELAFCRSDRVETLHCLHEYTVDQALNDEVLFTLVWQYLHDLYVSGRMERAALVNNMYALAEASGNIHEEPWQSMDMLGLLYDDVEEGIVTVESADRAFEAFIMERKPVTWEQIERQIPPGRPRVWTRQNAIFLVGVVFIITGLIGLVIARFLGSDTGCLVCSLSVLAISLIVGAVAWCKIIRNERG